MWKGRKFPDLWLHHSLAAQAKSFSSNVDPEVQSTMFTTVSMWERKQHKLLEVLRDLYNSFPPPSLSKPLENFIKYLRLETFWSCWITWSKLQKSIPITFPSLSFFSLQCYLWIQELPGCLIQRRQARGSAWNSESLGAGKLCCWLLYLCYSAKPSEFGNLALFISFRPFFLLPSWPLWLHLPKIPPIRYEAVYQHPQGRCSQAAAVLKNSRMLELCEAFGAQLQLWWAGSYSRAISSSSVLSCVL